MIFKKKFICTFCKSRKLFKIIRETKSNYKDHPFVYYYSDFAVCKKCLIGIPLKYAFRENMTIRKAKDISIKERHVDYHLIEESEGTYTLKDYKKIDPEKYLIKLKQPDDVQEKYNEQNHFEKELVNLQQKEDPRIKSLIRISKLYFELKKIIPTKRTRIHKNIPTLTYSPGKYSYTEICIICDFENKLCLEKNFNCINCNS